MSNTLTVRLPEDMIAWLKETSRATGVPVGKLIRDQLETARQQQGKQRFMRHAGTISGPADLSSRKGYSRR
jgi:Ribbon-helix-helix protein, copG family